MSIKNLNPYIHLNGTAEAAIRLYGHALDAKVESLMRYSEAPGAKTPREHENLVMHAALRIGEGVLMLCDTTPDKPAAAEGSVQICLQYFDLDGMATAFEALSEGGTVVMPLQDTSWGARFGMLTDSFGVSWMFNCALKSV